jgi:hypothetical protein
MGSGGKLVQEPSSPHGASILALCLHWIINMIRGEMFTEIFPVGDSREHSFHPLHPSQSSVRTRWQYSEVNGPTKSSLVFQLLKLHAVIGFLDVCQGNSSNSFFPGKVFFFPRKNLKFTRQNYSILLCRKTRDTKIKCRFRKHPSRGCIPCICLWNSTSPTIFPWLRCWI